MPTERHSRTARSRPKPKSVDAIHEAFQMRNGTRTPIKRQHTEKSSQIGIGRHPEISGNANTHVPVTLADCTSPDAESQAILHNTPALFYQKLFHRSISPPQPIPQPPLYRLLPSLFSARSESTTDGFASNETSATTTPVRRLSTPDISDPVVAYCDLPLSVQLSGHRGGPEGSFKLTSSKAFLFSSPALLDDTSSTTSRSLSVAQNHILSRASTADNGSFYLLPSSRRNQRASTASVAEYDTLVESLLEPCDMINIPRSMSEVLLRKPNMDGSEDYDDGSTYQCKRIFVRSDGNSAVHHLIQDSDLPSNVVHSLVGFLDPCSLSALKATCRSWYIAFLNLPSPALKLPRELLVIIFELLSPWDFNNARHVCRNWMAASLDRILLHEMLNRGGWSSDLRQSCSSATSTDHIHQPLQPEDIWTLSCRLARECALGAQWSGNGLPKLSENVSPSQAFFETGHVDFQDLASGFAGKGVLQSSGLVFTVSVCGEYLMVGEGGMIWIYILEGNTLRPLTSVICPRRVLAMSMDTTSHRLAVAALLDGRMGIMCELHVGSDRHGETSHARGNGDTPICRHGSSQKTQDKSSLLSSHVPQISRSTTIAQQINSGSVQTFEADTFDHITGSSSVSAYNAIGVRSNFEHYEINHIDRPDQHEHNWINQEWNLHLRSTSMEAVSREGLGSSRHEKDIPPTFDDENSVPVETGNRNIYRHLCSEDDPPRSVAICPQRRCVAFGCSAGIELHWVDALTGQDLNRWFPLTAPSDALYFLPPRVGLDSAKKLRLISSAAHPSERPALCRKFNAGRTWLTSFWGDFGLDSNGYPQAAISISDCDHCRAVPLSDGFHVLFTDPRTGFLCLGTDAPLGGPIKLLRKVIFVPLVEDSLSQLHAESTSSSGPQQSSSDARALVPRIYAATSNPHPGPRVVSVYGDDIMLYCVPPDVYNYSRTEHTVDDLPDGGGEGSIPVPESSEQSFPEWLRWFPNDAMDASPTSHPPTPPETEDENIWPVYVRGIHIGRLEGLVDVAINEVPGRNLTIWAFGLDGHAVIWELDIGRHQHGLVRKTVVGHDARVQHCFYTDGNGDAVMDDAYAQTKGVVNSRESTERRGPASDAQAVSELDGSSSYFGPPIQHTSYNEQGGRHVPYRCLPRALHIVNDAELAIVSAPTGDAMYDEEGNMYVSCTSIDTLDSDCGESFDFLDVLSS